MDGESRREPPMAVCPRDGEPLISTLRYPGAEFVCMVCGDRLGFLSPRAAVSEAKLEARYEHLQALFDGGTEPGTVAAAMA